MRGEQKESIADWGIGRSPNVNEMFVLGPLTSATSQDGGYEKKNIYSKE